MKRQKLGTTIIWTVCLLGMAALVWSRQPLGGSHRTQHPPLALAAEQPDPSTNAAPTTTPVSPAEISQPQANPPNSNVETEPDSTHSGAGNSFVLPDGAWIWEAEPNYKVVFQFEGHRLDAEISGAVEGRTMTVRVSADYHITTDSILYGVVTSAVLDTSQAGLEARLWEDSIARTIIEQPFAMRYRLDEDALTIKDFKMAQVGEEDELWEHLVQCLTSRFEPKETDSATP